MKQILQIIVVVSSTTRNENNNLQNLFGSDIVYCIRPEKIGRD